MTDEQIEYLINRRFPIEKARRAMRVDVRIGLVWTALGAAFR